ncbi:MAG: hypothetical protein OXI43_00620 [Candidatus Poribacteria bacterium]|nr:hypothetical protein [Candidatus Poribacteria bacterium]
MFYFVFHRYSSYAAGLAVLLLMAVSLPLPVLAEGEKVQWGKSIEDATKQAAETGKPIMMDFYTDR